MASPWCVGVDIVVAAGGPAAGVSGPDIFPHSGLPFPLPLASDVKGRAGQGYGWYLSGLSEARCLWRTVELGLSVQCSEFSVQRSMGGSVSPEDLVNEGLCIKKDDHRRTSLNQPPSAKSTLTRKTQWRDTYKEMLHPGFFVCFLVFSFSYLLSSLLFLLVRTSSFFFAGRRFTKKKKKADELEMRRAQGEDAPATRPVDRAAVLPPFAASCAVCLYLWFDISALTLSVSFPEFPEFEKKERSSSREEKKQKITKKGRKPSSQQKVGKSKGGQKKPAQQADIYGRHPGSKKKTKKNLSFSWALFGPWTIFCFF
ncbi:uncharacterized protein ARB_00188 [Trichophyton benhamiae CBS 112371]|uniref:Uncharacterized protein n=1 Tax=Arthroderma benhamiae (strain ATCC MYA-4681 / CBS 112371) TaxID=663331 RepID=D4AVH5_ARTBC|nr:uncharacterized protein ARB_00188 [Trichophyton benhamiae CBS 112371]EFE33097.1 hypothetical protein ARB_00188 [Trichophyton benhamiae CBS 112371]